MRMLQPDIFNPNCRSRRVLDLIANRWTAIVIYSLTTRTMRFGEMHRAMGISEKVLSTTLRAMEKDGLLIRKSFDQIPPKVEYSLTPLGASLVEPLSALCRWAQLHLPDVESAQANLAESALK